MTKVYAKIIPKEISFSSNDDSEKEKSLKRILSNL